MCPTPPEPPWTRTFWPGLTPALVSPSYAVMATRGRAAASFRDRLVGLFAMSLLSATMYSASEPGSSASPPAQP